MRADKDVLKRLAVSASENAYAPYSGFRVGAAVCASGRYYCGCNVENASYGLTVCAERNAIAAAIADGSRKPEAVCVYSPSGEPMPCGACLQVIAEFGSDCTVIVCGPDGDKEYSLKELMPKAFALSDKENYR